MKTMNIGPKKLAAFACAITVLVGLWHVLPDIDANLVDGATTRFGPMAVVLLVALGIVVSPIPSGVVAMVAGAIYGTWLGGTLTMAGAVLGAATAFLIARYFGRGWLMASNTGFARMLTKDRSQNTLMALIFASRMIPFISFDAVSYVAGVTPLRFWRFTAATAAGTAPVCVAFAAAGAHAAEDYANPVLLAALGSVTLLLPLFLLARRRFSPAAIA
jgi:uncharacterized membrane protein YdjX (TVP38/TMEM64 family)